MKHLAKFITDERTGLKYELCGDYYIIAGEDEPEREPIGIWGQRHLNHIKKHSKAFYFKMQSENKLYDIWKYKNDGASNICKLLFEEATDINFFVGKAINPAHQNPDLPINFSIKMNLVTELSACLQKMGKRIKVSYF